MCPIKYNKGELSQMLLKLARMKVQGLNFMGKITGT